MMFRHAHGAAILVTGWHAMRHSQGGLIGGLRRCAFAPSVVIMAACLWGGSIPGRAGSFFTVSPPSGLTAPFILADTYTPGQGGSSVISADPSPLTLNTFTGQSVATSVTLSTASTAPIPFSFSTTPTNGASWLSVSASNSQVSSSSTVTMSVFANATNITTQQTGSITIVPGNGGAQTVIPVTLNVNGSSGGATYTVSPTNVALVYPGGPVAQTVVIFSNNSSITTFNAAVSNCSGTNFLLLTGGFNAGTTIVNQPTGSGLNLTLNSPTSIAPGTYSCQAIVSNPTNSADQAAITVNLTVNGGGSSGGGFAFNPSSYTFTSTTGSTNTQSSGTSIQLVSSIQPTYSATFTSQSSPNGSANWITINGIGSSVNNQ